LNDGSEVFGSLVGDSGSERDVDIRVIVTHGRIGEGASSVGASATTGGGGGGRDAGEIGEIEKEDENEVEIETLQGDTVESVEQVEIEVKEFCEKGGSETGSATCKLVLLVCGYNVSEIDN